MNTIKISSLTKHCLAAKDGLKIRQVISESLNKGDNVVLDFSGISLFASPFFNASIGYLVVQLGLETYNKRISVTNINEVGRSTIERVIENALHYKSSERKDELTDIINNPDK